MIDYSQLYDSLVGTPAEFWLDTLPDTILKALDPSRHGDMARWLSVLQNLPTLLPSSIDLNSDAVRIGRATDISEENRRQLETQLKEFHPWRKGPLELFGIRIDAEWRSDWKWNRLKSAISPLQGRRVLDVGSGNGYYGWRMHGAGANLVIGVDPSLLYVIQYLAVRHFLKELPVFVLPLGIEALPERLSGFDTVFSMGVLYHRRSPETHLYRMKKFLRPRGELVLESLVIEGGDEEVLIPRGRYAKMRNVWSIPTPGMLVGWLAKNGYKAIRIVDISKTNFEEQRSTEWMRFESLRDFLDPGNPHLTVEGHPAPRRAIVIAEA